MSSKPHNNFDFLRMLAATLVMLSHAFQLSYSQKTWEAQTSTREWIEPVLWLSRGQLTLGHLSVLVFFVISGYLISMSQERSKRAWDFMRNRCLRIFPGLVVAVAFTVLVIGPLTSSLEVREYFSNPRTWSYFSNISLYFSVDTLPGVFLNNPIPHEVNGSMWTLKHEFTCYIVVCLLGVAGVFGKRSTIVIFLVCVIQFVMAKRIGLPGSYFLPIYFLMFFSSGMLLYLNRDKIKLSGMYALGATAVLIATALIGKAFVLAFAFLGGYLILYLAFAPWLKLHSLSKYGDFSYGLYIYAFPIQQMISYFLEDVQVWYLNFLLSFPIALMCAYFSWHLIEKPFLAMKGKSKKTVSQVGSRVP